MQTLITIHSWTRWLVLAGLLGVIAVGLVRYRRGDAWNSVYAQLTVMLIDIQVAIGAAMWLFYEGWNRGFFFAVFHPVAMLVALGIAHAGFVVAKRRAERVSWLVVTGASMLSLAVIVGAIPWDRL